MLELRPLPPGCATRRTSAACVACEARPYSMCGALNPEDLARLDALAQRGAFAAGDTLIRQGDRADTVFNLTSGSVRVYRLLPDGRRQITGFLFAGDFLSLVDDEVHAFSAEAIEPTTACRFRKAEFAAVVRQSPELERALFQRTKHELAAAQDQMVLLGRKTAQERLAAFLLQLPSRDPMRAPSPGHVRLPMTRTEIADYLGLTIETVSRVLSRLKTSGVIRLLSLHELRIEDPARLQALSEGAAD